MLVARIPPAEFLSLPLRAHSLLDDVLLYDVWVVELPGGQEGITLAEFRNRSAAGGLDDSPCVTRLLLQLRLLLGRIFHLDTPRPEQRSASYIRRLSEADRAVSLLPPGTKDGLFDVVYMFNNEALLEVINATVHAFLAQALTRTSTGYRLYWAVYVRSMGLITPAYLAFIEPFRRWVVYPQILRRTRERWIRLYDVPVPAQNLRKV